jgi:hypothetical protein
MEPGQAGLFQTIMILIGSIQKSKLLMPKQLLSCSEGFGAISKITTIPTLFASEKMIDIFVNFWFFKFS